MKFSHVRKSCRCRAWVVLLICASCCEASHAAEPKSCRKVELTGEVSAGQEWRETFGEGWAFRLVPIPPGQAGYSGWDLVVDREQPAGFPDALLVASPPYNSINEREIGTTFGLRAQDAIGWNPRSFRFLTDPLAFRHSQEHFRAFSSVHAAEVQPEGSAPHRTDVAEEQNMRWLMAVGAKSSVGEFRILDAHLTPGVADAAPFAQNWALAVSRTPHTFEAASSGKSTPRGELHWIRFSIDLWLPDGWKLPKKIGSVGKPCF